MAGGLWPTDWQGVLAAGMLAFVVLASAGYIWNSMCVSRSDRRLMVSWMQRRAYNRLARSLVACPASKWMALPNGLRVCVVREYGRVYAVQTTAEDVGRFTVGKQVPASVITMDSAPRVPVTYHLRLNVRADGTPMVSDDDYARVQSASPIDKHLGRHRARQLAQQLYRGGSK